MNASRLARKWDEAGDNRLAMAEALADEMAADLVTKADLAAAVQELRAEMHGVRGDLIKWVAGLLLVHAFGVAGMTVTLIRLLA
jgi:hypothetical protein